MSGEAVDLEKLVESVADGESLDWDEIERAAPDEQRRRLLRELRLIADVAEVHRSDVDEAGLTTDAPLTATSPSVVEWLEGSRALRGEELWGHLLLLRKIGEGSFGEVYLAHDTWLDHAVALKLLKPEAESRLPPTQLLQEARKLARIRHANVVTVHGADRHNGRVGFWMDFIDGETLAARVTRGRLSAGEAVHIGQEVCRALAAVHQTKLIHRDVKAQNVMRAFDGGRIILMDFGAGEFVDDPSFGRNAQGTPVYLAPELFRGGEASIRSDVYAVGVLLFYLVTGRFPVEAATQAALADAHARGERRRLRDERPDLPEPFVGAVERAIDPDPERRYGSAGLMEAGLAAESTTLPISVPLPGRPSRLAIGQGVQRVAAAVGAIVALTGALGFVAARSFDVVLRVDPDFSLGLADTFGVGAQALFPFVVYWIAGAALFGAFAALRALVRNRLAALWRRIRPARSPEPVTVATAIFLAGAVSLLLITWAHYDLVRALLALWSNPLAAPSDISVLSVTRRSVSFEHGQYSAVLSFVLALAAWRWFPRFEKRVDDPSTIRVLKWSTIALIFLVMALPTAPRRFVWDSFPVVSFGERPALVIGTTADELLLYAPDEPDRPRWRVRRDAPGLQPTGRTRVLFVHDPAP